MASNALYFPYIDMPRNRHTTTALLYWDQVFTIAPRGSKHVLNPRNENNLLIKEGVLNQLNPEDYSDRYPNFTREFLGVVEAFGVERAYPNPGGWAATPQAARTATTVHSGKVITVDLCDKLVERNLAIPGYYNWLKVEPRTADLFMIYLTLCLAQDGTLDCFPVTDKKFNIRMPAQHADTPRPLPSTEIRNQILNRILPTTAMDLNAEQILKIRSKHHIERVTFRRSIETFINDELSLVREKKERNRLIDDFIVRKREEIDEISQQLNAFSQSAPKRIGFATLGFATAALPIVDLLSGAPHSPVQWAMKLAGFGAVMAYAAINAVRDLHDGTPELRRNMAYAALLQHNRIK